MITRPPRRLSWARRIAFLLIANAAVFLLAAMALELVGRSYLSFRPSYEVLFLQPDREVGWKQVPGHDYTWTGVGWYAMDYSVPIQVNSFGYRDFERTLRKPAGTIRVALLGDSFVEAMQVPIEGTAGQRLRRKLQAHASGAPFEVLNFGVSNYGIGQYLLTWEQTAGRFEVDHVVVLMAGYLMARTTQGYQSGGTFSSSESQELWVRPTFLLKDGKLIREPAADYDEFVIAQDHVIEHEFGGGRVRSREISVLGHYLREWLSPATASSRRRQRVRREPSVPNSFEVNWAILRRLHRETSEAGATLSLVDASAYFSRKKSRLPARLRRFCAEEGIGYVNLSTRLTQSKEKGVSTRWKHDSHFNEVGNALFAEAMFEVLVEQAVAR